MRRIKDLVDRVRHWAVQSSLAIPSNLPLVDYALSRRDMADWDNAEESITRAALGANVTWDPGYDALLGYVQTKENQAAIDKAIAFTLQIVLTII